MITYQTLEVLSLKVSFFLQKQIIKQEKLIVLKTLKVLRKYFISFCTENDYLK